MFEHPVNSVKHGAPSVNLHNDGGADRIRTDGYWQIVGLDQIALAELMLADTAHLVADARLVRVRLAAVELAARSAGVRR